jgi:hypothetical protein
MRRRKSQIIIAFVEKHFEASLFTVCWVVSIRSVQRRRSRLDRFELRQAKRRRPPRTPGFYIARILAAPLHRDPVHLRLHVEWCKPRTVRAVRSTAPAAARMKHTPGGESSTILR